MVDIIMGKSGREKRRGGLLPMHLTDGETGETVYDNRDATAMAKFNVARGGITAGYYKVTDVDRWIDQNWMTDSVCPQCGRKTRHYFETVYEKQKYCSFCWFDIGPEPPADNEVLEKARKSYPYTVELFKVHYNNVDGRRAVIEKYIKEVLGGKVDVKEEQEHTDGTEPTNKD